MGGASSNLAGEVPSGVICPHCQTPMPTNAAFCPGCGHSMRPVPQPERLAAAAAYLTMIPGVVLLFVPQYRESRFVRFHCWQSIFLWGLFAVFTIVSLLLSNLAAAMFFLLFGILATLAMFFLWIVLTFKAWQGDRFELPILGAVAERMR